MPKVNDIIQVAESLEKSAIAVLKDRCVAVRNRNASCRKCQQACAEGAIEVASNEVRIDTGACVSCGACACVCPTEALVALVPPDSALLKAAADAAARAEGLAVIACARISSKKLADPSLYAEVPCLARVDESIMLRLAAHGASGVVLVDGDCTTCKYRSHVVAADEAIGDARKLIAAQGGDKDIERSSEFPADLLVGDATGLFGSTRRGFFADAAASAKETAMTAARTTIEQELGLAVHEASIGERLRVTSEGTMPRLSMPRHDAIVNAMDALGPSVAESIESRRFGKVEIDPAKCNACGMCGVFCTTGALSFGEGSTPQDVRSLEFSASECVRCGLCADVCWKHALTISPELPLSQLFDFEPVIFELAEAPRQKPGMFGRA